MIEKKTLSNGNAVIEWTTPTGKKRASERCPHRGGLLSCARVNEKTGILTCPLHHATFSLETGERKSGPECEGLEISKVTEGEIS